MSKFETVTFETTEYVRDHCLCLAAQRVARTLARRFDEALRLVGLTSGQFSLLMSLNQPAPPSIGSIAALLAMDRTTLTANLKPLERRGLVNTKVDPADRRGRLVILTAAGRTLLHDALPIWRRTQGEIDGLLTGTDAGIVREGLRLLA
ncbi:MarR family winged helix-turn-helix transcriptional regulator [Reyranella sp.]|uniref:MarR family winged helix-turn-helix transcriptional regulator n=1 Tax=Reyranella sp. TaxID=1929291 RepID=UPI0012279F79|nr:MarR family winged helix-turn-helix transcriptional regulator [Reyranella sp.]TAJ89769.1 MAG: MarR family transcriptional regulator [Reyranella sp.]